MLRFIVFAGIMATGPAISCEMERALLEVREPSGEWGIMAVEPTRPELEGLRFSVTAYGEWFERMYNRAAGGRSTVGVAVLRIEGQSDEMYVGTWKTVGTPYTWDDSWLSLPDLPEKLRWLESGPPLTTEPLWGDGFFPVKPLSIGEPVFQMMQSGPLQGFSLVFAGCEE